MNNQNNDYDFLKAHLWEHLGNVLTDQKRGLAPPPIQKPAPEDAPLVNLTPITESNLGAMPVREAIARRASRRQYTGEALTLRELSYLLWSTQGIRHKVHGTHSVTRNVPSAGARHPFETYILANNVMDLPIGLYRYLPLTHQLCQLRTDPELTEEIHQASYMQYVLESAAVFIWTAIPYRTAWRYGPLAPKLIAQDSGHLCQNLYLACESIATGTCAIGAYNQVEMDQILEVDGETEFTIYMATVGKT
jgi:SagB-type dehydrogenase family enzyme